VQRDVPTARIAAANRAEAPAPFVRNPDLGRESQDGMTLIEETERPAAAPVASTIARSAGSRASSGV
jgi:hypothetical protein